MQVIVTGHQGYIGPVFAQHVASRGLGWRLTGIDSGLFRDHLTGADPSALFAREIAADVRDIPDEVLAGCDAVVCLAAVSNDPMGKEFEQATYDINCAAAVRLAEQCRVAGVRRFIYASSCSIYGAGSDAPRRETDLVNPLTAYAKAKVMAENALLPLAGDDFQVTCLRFATACGPSPRLRLDLVVNDFVASAILTGQIDILSDGSPWRPLIATDDMARAIEWALLRDGAPALAINIGSHLWTWQIRDLAHAVADVLGDTKVSINAAAQPDARSYKVDFSLFERLAPDHQPLKRFDDMVLELKDQVTALDLGDRTFRQSRFIRLNVLSDLKARGLITSGLFRT